MRVYRVRATYVILIAFVDTLQMFRPTLYRGSQPSPAHHLTLTHSEQGSNLWWTGGSIIHLFPVWRIGEFSNNLHLVLILDQFL